jgi:hypothetical protein
MKIRGYIRCGMPDCDWGFAVPTLGEDHLQRCYTEFREHCIKRHELNEADTEAQVFLDFEEWTLLLLKK